MGERKREPSWKCLWNFTCNFNFNVIVDKGAPVPRFQVFHLAVHDEEGLRHLSGIFYPKHALAPIWRLAVKVSPDPSPRANVKDRVAESHVAQLLDFVCLILIADR